VTLQQCRLQISPHGRQSDLGLRSRSVERRMRTAMYDALQRLLDRMDARIARWWLQTWSAVR